MMITTIMMNDYIDQRPSLTVMGHVPFGHRRSGALVFTLGGGDDRLNACRQAAIEVTGLEMWSDLLADNPFA